MLNTDIIAGRIRGRPMRALKLKTSVMRGFRAAASIGWAEDLFFG
jgi:hypothetical protein